MLAAARRSGTARCVRAERAVSRALGGSCTLPLGAYAVLDGRHARAECARCLRRRQPRRCARRRAAPIRERSARRPRRPCRTRARTRSRRWMSLAGRGIVVTRPRDLAAALAAAIEAPRRARDRLPDHRDPAAAGPCGACEIARIRLVVFVSPSAVRLRGACCPPGRRRRAVAIGARHAARARAAGIAAVIASRPRARTARRCSRAGAAADGGQARAHRARRRRPRAPRRIAGAARRARRVCASATGACGREADPAPLLEAWRRGEVARGGGALGAGTRQFRRPAQRRARCRRRSSCRTSGSRADAQRARRARDGGGRRPATMR